MGSQHGGGPYGCCPLLQYSRLPQLVAHQGRLFPHLLIEPLRELSACWLPLMGLGRAGLEVRCRFGVRPTEETRGVQYRVSVGGPVRQDSHRRDVVHAVCRYVALPVTIEPVEGESTPRCVVHSPWGLVAGPCRYGGPILQPVAQCRWGQPALVPVGHGGEEEERASKEPRQVNLRRLLRRCINSDVQVRYLVRRRGYHVDGRGRGEALAS